MDIKKYLAVCGNEKYSSGKGYKDLIFGVSQESLLRRSMRKDICTVFNNLRDSTSLKELKNKITYFQIVLLYLVKHFEKTIINRESEMYFEILTIGNMFLYLLTKVSKDVPYKFDQNFILNIISNSNSELFGYNFYTIGDINYRGLQLINKKDVTTEEEVNKVLKSIMENEALLDRAKFPIPAYIGL